MRVVEENEVITLIDSNYKKYLIKTTGDVKKIKGIGVIKTDVFIGAEIGEKISIGQKNFWIMKTSLIDKIQGLKRKAQIILPKDAAHIIMYCSIEPGDKVLEAGIGSGALTIALANAVAPNGQVVSYEIKNEFIKHAMKNIRKADFEKLVKTKQGDVTQGIDEKELDAVIIDIPNPWDVVKHAWGSLKTGGFFCSYSPLSSQVVKTVQEIKKHRFIEVKTYENIQREMVVTDKGMRPSFKMLGHTGYLTFARKVP